MLDFGARDLQSSPACWNRRLWTEAEVQDRLAQAAYCLRRMPFSRHSKPQEWGQSWPDVVHDWMGYGWESAKLDRFPPLPPEISLMDETLGWLHLLNRDQRVVVWARAQNWGWKQIVTLDMLERHGKGRSSRTLRAIMHDGLARILSHLNGTPPRLVVTPEMLWKGMA